MPHPEAPNQDTSGWRKAFGPSWFAGIASGLVLALVALGLASAFSSDEPSGSADPGATSSDRDQRGTGSEPLDGKGTIEGAEFVPESALVLPSETGLDLRIYEDHYECGSVQRAYVDDASWFEVDLADSADEVSALPLDKPIDISLAGVGVTVQREGNAIESYSSGEGRVVVTRIETSSGGVWHGRVSILPVTTKQGKAAFNGTFAARWCGG